MEIKWTAIKKDVNGRWDLPKEEVLAVNLGGCMLVGGIGVQGGVVYCESKDSIIDVVTHYILTSDLHKGVY